MTNKQKELIEDNMGLIGSFCKSKGINDEDIFSELTLHLCETIKNYDPLKGKFSTFVFGVMDKKLLHIYYTQNAQKRKNTAERIIYLDKGNNLVNGKDMLFEIADDEIGFNEVNFRDFYTKSKERLTEREYIVINYISNGYNKSEIATKLNISKQRLYQICSDIKRKLRNCKPMLES